MLKMRTYIYKNEVLQTEKTYHGHINLTWQNNSYFSLIQIFKL